MPAPRARAPAQTRARTRKARPLIPSLCACVCSPRSPPLALAARAQGSWWLFGFQITSPFVLGVGLVILSIFIYGSKPEQIAGWIEQIKLTLGMGKSAECNLVAQMEPLVEDEEKAAPQTAAGGTPQQAQHRA